MSIIPIKDKVLIAPFKAQEQVLSSGIVISAAVDKRDGQGMVVALGKEVESKELFVGDLILYKEWSGIKVKHDGKDYLLLDEEDIIAILADGYLDDLGMSIPEQARKYFKSMIQPFRQGKFSKEFVEAYPDKTKEMVKNGMVTQAEVNNAKYLFKDLAGWKDRKKSQ